MISSNGYEFNMIILALSVVKLVYDTSIFNILIRVLSNDHSKFEYNNYISHFLHLVYGILLYHMIIENSNGVYEAMYKYVSYSYICNPRYP